MKEVDKASYLISPGAHRSPVRSTHMGTPDRAGLSRAGELSGALNWYLTGGAAVSFPVAEDLNASLKLNRKWLIFLTSRIRKAKRPGGATDPDKTLVHRPFYRLSSRSLCLRRYVAIASCRRLSRLCGATRPQAPSPSIGLHRRKHCFVR